MSASETLDYLTDLNARVIEQNINTATVFHAGTLMKEAVDRARRRNQAKDLLLASILRDAQTMTVEKRLEVFDKLSAETDHDDPNIKLIETLDALRSKMTGAK